MRWDSKKETLLVYGLGALSSSNGIDIHCDVDMNTKTLKNFKFYGNATFQNLQLELSTIIDTKLINATFDNTVLGSVMVDDFQ